MSLVSPIFKKAADENSVGMTVAYNFAGSKLESAVVSKRMKSSQSSLQHGKPNPNPRMKGSKAENFRSRWMSSAEFNKSSSGDEFEANMQVKYARNTESIPKVSLSRTR